MDEMRSGLPVLSFEDQPAFAYWLERQPPTSPGLWLKLLKTGAPARLTKADAVDAALCHGWIDGQLNRYDDAAWLVRFTPRRPRSRWSAINRRRAEELVAAGRMRAGGSAQIEAAKADGRWDDAYASARAATVPPDLQAALDRNPPAGAFFATLKGANRYAILHRIAAVKRPETRARKIDTFVAMLERGETIHG